MSKGNLLFGQARGKVGDLVLTRLAGEQVARARNRAPKNPRTTKQMVQRAMMATLVEFFTRGQRNLFKFAFESKRPGESDYNAFVRANMGKVPVQSKKTIKENGYVGGNFVMSQGSLPAPAFLFDEDNVAGAIVVPAIGVAGSALTIGKLSELLIAQNGLQDGDVITIVGIVCHEAAPLSTLETCIQAGELVDTDGNTLWNIQQFTLDTASSALVSSLGIFDTSAVTASSTSIPIATSILEEEGYDQSTASMLTVIVSRVVGSAVKVSSSQLVCNAALAASNEVGMSDEWKSWVAKHYMEATSFAAKPEDILKGSISKN